jgi:MFS family permease
MTVFSYSEKKIVGTLFASQSLFSASVFLIFTLSSIEAIRLAGGNTQWAGVPSTISLIASALIAYPVGRLVDVAGRRIGLALGHLLGVIGAFTAAGAILLSSLPLYLFAIFLLGLSRGPLELSRYAASDVSPPERRSRAISFVVFGGTAGSLAGPTLIRLANTYAPTLGIPVAAAPWLMAGFLFIVGIVIILLLLWPDPSQIAKHLTDSKTTESSLPVIARPTSDVIRDPRAQTAVLAMVFSQLAMVIVMTITPQHMHEHTHDDPTIAWVLVWHTLGMFGFSFFTGWLADKVGRSTTILAGGVITTLACIIAPFSIDVEWLALALFLLGLGWNFCFVAGSTLLDESVNSAEKGRVQGGADAIVKVASGIGSLGSGFLFSSNGFATTSWLTIAPAIIPAILVIVLALRKPASTPELLSSD